MPKDTSVSNFKLDIFMTIKFFYIPLCFLLFAGIVTAQIQLVHVTSCGPSAEPGHGCSIPATGQGHLIVVGWQIGDNANTSNTINSMTDNVGNVYSEVPGARSVNSGASDVSDIWYAKNSVAGATTLTINPNSPVTKGGAVIWEFSGADPVAPIDQVGCLNSQPASATPTGAQVTTTSASEVIVSLAAHSGSLTGIASGNSFINDSLIKNDGWARLITTTAGTFAAEWTGTSGTYASSTASFKSASGEPPSVSLSWNPSTSPNLTGYNIYRGTTSGGPYSKLNSSVDPSTVYNDTTVQAGLTYYYVSTAVNYTGEESIYSNQATANVPGNGVPPSVSLSWNASTSPNLTGYNIYRSTTSGGPYSKLNSSAVPSTAYNDAAVQSGLTYYYVSTAVNTSGEESIYSNQATAVVPVN